MNGLTWNLGEFVSSLEFKKIPAKAVETVKRGFIDCIGVMFAGRDEPVVEILREFVISSPRGEATILYDKGQTTSPEAALLNATAAAASMAGGLTANFGSMTKPLQVARAAQSGLLAARLAARGLTASPDALEHRGGFMNAFSPAGRVRLDGEIAAGRDWHILRSGLNIKRYPVCYALHRSIDGLMFLNSKHRINHEK